MKNKTTKTERKKLLENFIENNSFEYSNPATPDGKPIPMPVSKIKINPIPSTEPNNPDIYENWENWYEIKNMIEPLAEQAYFSYYIGAYYASFCTSVICIELTMKYEYKYNKGEESLDDLSLGDFTSIEKGCEKRLALIGLSKHQTELALLNALRNGLMHFNGTKLMKAAIETYKKSCKEGDEIYIQTIVHKDPASPTGNTKGYDYLLSLGATEENGTINGIKLKTEKYYELFSAIPTNNIEEISPLAHFAYTLNQNILDDLYGKER